MKQDHPVCTGNTHGLKIKIFITLGILLVCGILTIRFFGILFPLHGSDFTGYADSWRIYDKKGRLLRETVNKDGARARWVELDMISPLVIDATIVVEDERFYFHPGTDWFAMVRAIVQNLSAGENVSGASTLTMQLARLMYQLPHTIFGKIAQIIAAGRIEHLADKKTILLNYLNRSPYGAGTIGIEAASHRYFGKPSLHLSLAEAALLAGLPNAPTRYNPLEHFDLAKKRQAFVLYRMKEAVIITEIAYKQALSESLIFYREIKTPGAMHFTDYVISLDPPPGDVYTTLDYELNNQVEQLVRDHVKTLAAGGLTNASVIILDNATGAILVMVGSVDYWDGENGAVNGTVSLRQPGSTLKPFTYGLALEREFTPVSVIPDVNTSYIDSNGDRYTPQNYSEKYYGPVLLAEALGRSLNVSAIWLANALGTNAILSRLRKAGFTSLDKKADFYGLGLTLGNGEVTLLELARGYALFPREGRICEPKAILNPGTNEGDESSASGEICFSEEVCYMITDILSNEQLRIRAFGALNPLLLEFPMAIKTGTSSNWRDNWVVGYTKDITVAVWAGDFKGSPMNQVSGAIGAGPLFRKIAHHVVDYLSLTPGTMVPPEGLQKVVVCKLSGETPAEFCTDFDSWYVEKNRKQLPPCSVHRKVIVDIRNGLLASSSCPSRFTEEQVHTFLDPGYSDWMAEHYVQLPPMGYSPLCMPDEIPIDSLIITQPCNGDVFIIEPGYNRNTQSLELKGEARPYVGEVEWFVDDIAITTVPWPYSASWRLEEGIHSVFMKSGDKTSDHVTFTVK